MKGFSKRNLVLIRQWYRYWTSDLTIAKQAVAQLASIPWGRGHDKITKWPKPCSCRWLPTAREPLKYVACNIIVPYYVACNITGGSNGNNTSQCTSSKAP